MPERLNENAYVSYPILEDQPLLADTGEALPPSLLLDFSATIYAEVNAAPVLSEITVNPGGDGLTVVIDVDGTDKSVYVPAGVVEYLAVTDVDPAFWSANLVFGEGVNDFCADHPGESLSFALEFEPSRVAYVNGHVVDSVAAPGEDPLVGDVKVREGYNFSINIVKATNTLTLSAQRGGGLGLPCNYSDVEAPGIPEASDCEDYLYSINGLTPDWYGDFKLEGGPGVIVEAYPDEHKIKIKTSLLARKPGCVDGC